MELLEEAWCTSTLERTKTPPVGIAGGLCGRPNSGVIRYPDGRREPVAKATGLRVPKGTVYELRCGGGGGYGPPAERDPALVRDDLREGYITEAHARRPLRPRSFGLMAGDYPDLVRPSSLEEAIGELERLGEDGAPLAGCTWVMRAPSRGERLKRVYVSLQDLDELLGVAAGESTVIGARVTHAELGRLAGDGPLGALREAAQRSANRAVRNVATVGGNLCSAPFPASDLMPALLASEATVQVEGPSGTTSVDLADFLETRSTRPARSSSPAFACRARPVAVRGTSG